MRSHTCRLCVTTGVAGHYVMLYDTRTGDAIQRGIGNYGTPEAAQSEAYDWAMSEGWDRSVVDPLPSERPTPKG